jgi:nicotinate-nucleotide adenylyltransferase
MARLAFADLPKVMIDARETERAGPSYTVDTLRELQREQPGAELFLLLGADQARALPSWHAWQEIVQTAIICVADRGDGADKQPRFSAPKLLESRFRQLPMPALPVSATEIRNQIATRQALGPLVLEPVARYIEHHHLYQTA